MNDGSRARLVALVVLLGLLVAGSGLGFLGAFDSSSSDAERVADSAGPDSGHADEASAGLEGRPHTLPEEPVAIEAGSAAETDVLRIRVVDSMGRPAREMLVSFQTGAWSTGADGRRRFERAPHAPLRLQRATHDGELSVSAAWVDEFLVISGLDPIEGTDAHEHELAWLSASRFFERPRGEVVLDVYGGRSLRIYLRTPDGQPIDPRFPGALGPDPMKCDVGFRGRDGEFVGRSIALPSDPVPGAVPHLCCKKVPVRGAVLRLGKHPQAFRGLLEVPVPDGVEAVDVEVPPARRLRVRLEDAEGEPLYGSVTLRGQWQGCAWEDLEWVENGTADIEGVPAGASVFVGVAPFSLIERAWAVPDVVVVAPTTRSLTFTLRPGTPVTLSIVGPRLEPVPRARMRVDRRDGGQWVHHGSLGIAREDRGVLVIPGLGPGHYRVTAEPRVNYRLARARPVEFDVPGPPVTVVCPAAPGAPRPRRR